MPIILVIRFNNSFEALKTRAINWDNGIYTMYAELADENVPWVKNCIAELSNNSLIKNELSIEVGGNKLFDK